MFCDLDDGALLCLKVVSPGVSCVFVEPELSCLLALTSLRRVREFGNSGNGKSVKLDNSEVG
jgi:hypothetical protein